MASRFAILSSLLLLQLLHSPVQASECSNPVPGLHRMVLGVDVAKLNLLGLGNDDGFRSSVIKLTCTAGQKWTSPNGTAYDKPDQIWRVTPQPWDYLQSTVSIYKDTSDVQEQLGKMADGGPTMAFWFSKSAFFTEIQEAIVKSSLLVAQVSSVNSATTLEFHSPPSGRESTLNETVSWGAGNVPELYNGTLEQQSDSPGLDLDPRALEQLEKIKGTYAADPSGYDLFIEKFGTHYFHSGNFGGLLTALYKTQQCYLHEFGENELKRNVETGFRENISSHGGAVKGSTTVTETFEKYTTSDFLYFGGDTNLLSRRGIKDWLPTVEANPWLYSGKLQPISDLIQDKVKKAGMEEAVSQYLMRRYVEGLETYLKIQNNTMSISALATFQKKLNDLKATKVLDEGTVLALGEAIETAEEELVQPWFLHSTELCFQWGPNQEGDSCSGTVKEDRVCALVNVMTPQYIDDTDGRGDGCSMQWGILNNEPELPAWFREVKLCVRWAHTGHPNQCGDGDGGEFCANVNSFTDVYRDNTDDRDGGCKLFWKLSVPDIAPIWMQKVELCFSWSPEGDESQCNSSSGSRTLCSKPNEWTDYYTDNTDSRTGGCSMQWSLKVHVSQEETKSKCGEAARDSSPRLSCNDCAYEYWHVIVAVVGGFISGLLIVGVPVLIYRCRKRKSCERK